MSTDFFDDDLKNRAEGPEGVDEGEVSTVQPVLGATLNKMARKKEAMSSQAASAIQEIERLRLRQEELEREKSALEELTRKQDQYARDKMDIVEKLDRSILAMEREESQAARMVELLSESRARFKNTIEEIRMINEESWGDHNYNEELNRAMIVIENARMDYKKALAKIEAANWHGATESTSKVIEGADFETGGERDFGYWVKAGFAFTLPLILFLALIGLFFLMHK